MSTYTYPPASFDAAVSKHFDSVFEKSAHHKNRRHNFRITFGHLEGRSNVTAQDARGIFTEAVDHLFGLNQSADIPGVAAMAQLAQADPISLGLELAFYDFQQGFED